MTINTLARVREGLRMPQPIVKATSPALPTVGGLRGWSPYYTAGNPAAAAAFVALAGRNVAGPVLGMLPRNNPPLGQEARLAKFAASATQPGVLWLVDRLWEAGGYSPSLFTPQTYTGVSLPPRDNDGSSNGEGVLAGIEWGTSKLAGAPAHTLTYTNQDGTSGRTASSTGVAASYPAGTIDLFTLAAGDRGIRAPTDLTQTVAGTSGLFNLILFRVLAQVEVNGANIGNAVDAVSSCAPRIHDDSVLQLIFFPSSNAVVNLVGSYQEAHG